MNKLYSEGQDDIQIPDFFADKVMNEILELHDRQDWFENLVQKIELWSTNRIVEYGFLTAGFSIGVASFIRFVAFIFIPVG